MLKKMFVIFLSLCLLGITPALAQQDAVKVVTTFFPLYVATINITAGVPGVVVLNLTPPEAGCLHEYQMTTVDRTLLADADIIVMNGAGLDDFLNSLLPTLSGHTVDASAGIELLPGRHEADNPHVWVSVAGMKAQVKNIIDGLCQADPSNAQTYAKNGNDYLNKLSDLERSMYETLLPIAGQPIITFHEAFDYFARDYDLRVVSVMENDAGNAPSARELTDVIEIALKEQVSALFTEPSHQNVTVDIIARETKLPVYTLDPVVNGEATVSAVNAYIQAMLKNAETLLEALR